MIIGSAHFDQSDMSAARDFILLLFSLCVVIATGCPTQSCIHCPVGAPTNCTINRLSFNIYTYYCEAPFPCVSQAADGLPCTGVLHYLNGQFLYAASQWNTHPTGNCTNYPSNCVLNLQVDRLENFAREAITCDCYGNDCQATINITVSVTSLYSTSLIESSTPSPVLIPSSSLILPSSSSSLFSLQLSPYFSLYSSFVHSSLGDFYTTTMQALSSTSFGPVTSSPNIMTVTSSSLLMTSSTDMYSSSIISTVSLSSTIISSTSLPVLPQPSTESVVFISTYRILKLFPFYQDFIFRTHNII